MSNIPILNIVITFTIILISFETVYCQREKYVKRPEDLFPNSNIYVPKYQNEPKEKIPFRDTFGREHPDTLFLGFFPIWSMLLVALAFMFGFIGICGFIGYLLGCRNPNKKLTKKNLKIPKYLHSDDDTTLRMIETDRDYEKSFNKSKLINTSY